MLVTGGAGFIGSHSAVALLEAGHEVRAFDWLQPPVHEPGKRPDWLPEEVELVVGDVRDRTALTAALGGIEAVLHLAAYQDYLPDFSTFFHVNTVGTALLYELIVEGGLDVRKVVVASSQAVYGEGLHHCPEHGRVRPGLRPDSQLREGGWELRCEQCGRETVAEPTDEGTVNPQNQYALSKYTQELVAFSLGRRYGIPTTCLRYSITQGRWQSPRNPYSGICRIFTVRARAGRPAVVFEDGGQRRDYVYVGDVARANLLCLTDSRTDHQAYNVGGGQVLTALEYADIVNRVIGSELEPELPGYYRFGDTRHIVSDTGKLQGMGWSPSLTVPQVVAEYAGWVATAGFEDRSDEGIQRMLRLGTLRRVGG
ncbi:MAG: NAD-dependent epimerase/dehydratase family protein [Candidatus Dormibacteraceae bacterium]